VAPKTPTKHVAKPVRKTKAKHVVTPASPKAATVTHRELVKQAGGKALPYTGLPVGALLFAGLLTMGAGLLVRRKFGGSTI
jgi:hypothetical protein